MGYILHRDSLLRSPKDGGAWNLTFFRLVLRSPEDGAAWNIFCTGYIVA